MKISEIKTGDIFSEESHYKVVNVGHSTILFKHLQTGKNVELAHSYVESICKSADQYTRVENVGLEDSRDGNTLGIRTIFNNIGTSKVFTVTFTKQPKLKTKKQLKEEIEKQKKEVLDIINSTKKEPLYNVVSKAIDLLQANPIGTYEPIETRVLRGYKQSFNSRDGKYECLDIDLMEIRLVNINTIKELIMDGVKYVVNK